MRVNLSVAIVAMVKKSHEESLTNENSTLESCPMGQNSNSNNSGNISSNVVGEFTWNEKTQGFILGSFYYSYGLANLIGGPTADYFGGRMLIGVATLASAILTILTPMASRLGAGFLITIRVLEGCFHGVTFPAMNKLITKWYTTEERSKFTGIIFAGIDFGCVLTFPISGWLCESEFLGGWPSVFYVFGGLSIIWCLFWFTLIRDDPKKHPRISAEELKYILEGSPNTEQKHPVPWSSILGSKYFWTTVIAQTGLIFGYIVMLSELPTYFANILHIPINNNGLLTAMPFLAAWIFSMCYSFAVDKAIKSEYLTILSVRRLSVAISGYGPMLCLIGMCFVNCNVGGAFAVLILSGALVSTVYCGPFSSHSDLSPRFAGTLMGLATAFGATIYELFITTEVQPWNEPKTMNEKVEK
ncbi:putative inorganic phosphate cotransporter [Armadillidium nasatum]|uniref:Putative inorganic phosphate cotransporter n=1 Tax=Armadillidium nasatum TaxID=96803 RepID=A0A5N5T9B9_9CRUS|nr:putative inorganic phosphate cotransporter [Armadillidium nasatum]